MKLFSKLLLLVFILAGASFTLQGQSASTFRVTGKGQPQGNNVSPYNTFIGGELVARLSPDDADIREDILWNGLVMKEVYSDKTGRFALPILTKFNLDDFNIIDIFDEDGISASIAPYFLLTTTESPLVIHGALTANFDVATATPSVMKGFVGLEQTLGKINGELSGSIGLNAHWGNGAANTQGTSWEGVITFPISPTTAVLALIQNTKRIGEDRETGLQVGLISVLAN